MDGARTPSTVTCVSATMTPGKEDTVRRIAMSASQTPALTVVFARMPWVDTSVTVLTGIQVSLYA